MDPIGTYSFLPWLRRGLSTAATAAAPGTQRAMVSVDMTVHADKIGGGELTQPVHRDVQLYGAGDVVGLDARAIVRTEPRAWITNFEPNYLPFVEFVDEDLPVALHARGARRAAAADAVAHAARARRGRVRGRHCAWQAAALHRHRPIPKCFPLRKTCGRGRTCTSTAASMPRARCSPTPWRKCCRSSTPRCTRTRTWVCRGSCARAISPRRPAITRSSSPRSKPAGLAAWAWIRPAHRPQRTSPGRPTRVARLTSRVRIPCTTVGISAPAPSAISSTSCGCSSRDGCPRRSASATWTRNAR